MKSCSNLWEAFHAIGTSFGERTALAYPERNNQHSYSSLYRLSVDIAAGLVESGYKRGDVGCIFHDKSPEGFACMLACLRLGIVYTNLDPENPWSRLEKILETCKPRFAINCFRDLAHLKSLKDICNVLDPSEITSQSLDKSIDMPPVESIHASDPAYIMFTSGSTGVPKGAVMSHSNLLGFIRWGQDEFKIDHNDVLTNINPIFFDNSVFDFYIALFSGATLVPFSQEQVREPRRLVRLVSESKCTIWFSVPSLLIYLLTTRSLSKEALVCLRKIIFGGEGFPKPKLKELFNIFEDQAQLVNVYGPTECTCICSAHTVVATDFTDMHGLVTLGKLARDFEGEIVSQGNDCSDVGELLLFGPHVGLGYYNDPQRTSGSFTQNPRHTLHRDVGYRTGDIVRRDSVGQLHFKGRIDFQVKHMGYRIEIEEIEAALSNLEGVDQCAVVYKNLGEGMGKIIAFVASSTLASSEDLVEQVGLLVPSYMVPKQIRLVSDLPKNANGKIDRSLLKEMVT